MKEFKNMQNLGSFNYFTEYAFIFNNERKYGNRPYFKTLPEADTKIVVRLSGALTEAYDAGRIKEDELYDCDVLILDTTKAYPEYVLKIPNHLLLFDGIMGEVQISDF
jgi:hypothetical protein